MIVGRYYYTGKDYNIKNSLFILQFVFFSNPLEFEIVANANSIIASRKWKSHRHNGSVKGPQNMHLGTIASLSMHELILPILSYGGLAAATVGSQLIKLLSKFEVDVCGLESSFRMDTPIIPIFADYRRWGCRCSQFAQEPSHPYGFHVLFEQSTVGELVSSQERRGHWGQS